MNELISIVVPVYNVEKYLGTCVESILKQTYSNIESEPERFIIQICSL